MTDRPKTLNELLAERRDAAPMRTSCGVEGCVWPGFEGTAAECREQAAEHRRRAHPDLSDRGSRVRTAQARPVKHPSVQTAEDRRIVATLAQRQKSPRGQARSPLTAHRLDELQARLEGGQPLKEAAAELAPLWGYRSVDAFTAAASRKLRERGISPNELRRSRERAAAAARVGEPRERRPGTPGRKPRILTAERLAYAEARIAAGETPYQVAKSVYRDWGSRSANSVAVMLTNALKRRDERRAA